MGDVKDAVDDVGDFFQGQIDDTKDFLFGSEGSSSSTPVEIPGLFPRAEGAEFARDAVRASGRSFPSFGFSSALRTARRNPFTALFRGRINDPRFSAFDFSNRLQGPTGDLFGIRNRLQGPTGDLFGIRNRLQGPSRNILDIENRLQGPSNLFSAATGGVQQAQLPSELFNLAATSLSGTQPTQLQQQLQDAISGAGTGLTQAQQSLIDQVLSQRQSTFENLGIGPSPAAQSAVAAAAAAPLAQFRQQNIQNLLNAVAEESQRSQARTGQLLAADEISTGRQFGGIDRLLSAEGQQQGLNLSNIDRLLSAEGLSSTINQGDIDRLLAAEGLSSDINLGGVDRLLSQMGLNADIAGRNLDRFLSASGQRQALDLGLIDSILNAQRNDLARRGINVNTLLEAARFGLPQVAQQSSSTTGSSGILGGIGLNIGI